MPGGTVAQFFEVRTGPDEFALTPRRFLPIPVMMPLWIDCGPKDDLFFATTGRIRRKERGPAGTKKRMITQILAKALVSADHQVQLSLMEVAQRGMLRRSPRRRPGFQKSSSPTVGGGMDHEISSHPVPFSALRFPVCLRRAQ